MTTHRAVAVTADDVRLHDEILNHGIVDSEPLPVGMFRVFCIRGTTWSLGNGRADITKTDLSLHCADTVWVWREA